MRPGRLDRQFYVSLPDAATRKKVLAVHLRSKPVAEDVDLDELVALSEGRSGAEIASACNEAGYKALEKAIAAGDEGEQTTGSSIEASHLKEALLATPPRIKSDLLRLYDEFRSREA
jgi:SpoVK/Ycf46/Vps4 family AAA+-type ATPase